MRQDPERADVVPNNYFDDSEEDYDYDNYLDYGRAIMNDLGREIPPDFDPFFDLPDGNVPSSKSL